MPPQDETLLSKYACRYIIIQYVHLMHVVFIIMHNVSMMQQYRQLIATDTVQLNFNLIITRV